MLSACSSNEPEYTASRTENSITDPNFISLEEALQNAETEFGAVYGTQTRSGKEVVETELFRAKTRSGDNDLHGYYLVNYDDGFAMLSADRRMPAVIALSNEGSMHLSDTITNRGLSWYVNDALPSLEAITIIKPDTTIHQFNPPTTYTKTTVVVSEKLLTGFLSKFHQNYPYNMYCYTSAGDRAVVGCAPIALGTVMGYYQWPESYGSYSFDWTSMYSSSTNQLWSRLFEILGRSSNLNVNYGTSASGANPNNITKTMSNMGYKNSKFIGYNKTILDSELSNGNPIIMGGYRTYTDSETNQEVTVGHAWVIDGGYYTKETNQVAVGGDYIYTYYYHCVWGWGGTANGYFVLNTSSPSFGGTPAEPDENTSGSANTYSDLTMVYDYTPNK